MATTLGSLVVDLRANTALFLRGMERANASMGIVATSAERMSRTFGVLQNVVAGVGIGALVKDIADAGVQFQQWNISLETSTGSAKAASEAMAFVREESNRLGLSLPIAATGFSQLVAAAQGTALEGENVRRIFTAVSEASSKMGLTADQTQGSLLAITQIMSKGKVQAEELRGQLGERLPIAFKTMADALGVTTAELDKMLQKGSVLAESALPLFADELSEKMGLAGMRVDTAQAAFARFDTALFDLKNTIAQSGLLDTLAEMARLTTRAIDGWVSLGQTFGLIAGQGTAITELQDKINKQLEFKLELLEKLDEAERGLSRTTIGGLEFITSAQPDEARIKSLNEAIAGVNERLQQSRAEMQKLIAPAAAVNNGLSGIGDGAKKALTPLEKFEKSIVTDAEATELLFGKLEILENKLDSGAISWNEYERRVQSLTGAIKSAVSPIDVYKAKLEEQAKSFAFVQEQIEELVLWYEALDPTEQVQNTEYFNNEMERLGVTIKHVVDTSNREIETWRKLTLNSLDRLDDAFLSFWESFLRGNENAFETFKNLAIRVLAEIIHEYTTKKIVANIIQIFDTEEKPRGPSGGAAVAGASQALGSAAGFGGPILTAIGALFSPQVLIPAIAGGLLGSIFGDDAPRNRPSLVYAGNDFLDLTQPGVGVSTPSPFGPGIGFEFSRFGGQGQLSNDEVEDILFGLEMVSDAIVTIDSVLAGTLTELETSDIGALLAQAGPTVDRYSPKVISNFIRDRFSTIFTGIDVALGEVFDEFSRGLEGDELLQFASDLANINKIFSEGGMIFSDVATAAETVNILMGDFAAQGETFADVIDRISQASQALFSLGLEGDTQAGARFNLSVLEAVGGDVNRLNSLVENFLTTFFTQQENVTRRIDELTGVIPDLLAELGTSRDTFAGDFQAALSSGILSPDDVVTWLKAAEALGTLIDLEADLDAIRAAEAADAARKLAEEEARIVAAREAEVAAILDEVDAINVNVDALNEQITAQETLRRHIQGIIEDVNSAFGGGIENIRLSLLDDEGQFNFFKDIAESLAASLPSITDPDLLRDKLLEIEQRVGQAFGVLDPEQQGIVGKDFIKFLEDTLHIGNKRLEALSEETLTRQDELENRRDFLLTQVADRLEQVAALNAQSTDNFSAAVNVFSSAASIPQTVNITLTEPLVGA